MTQINNRFKLTKDLQQWIGQYPDYKEQIKILRQSSGMTQEQLARMVDRTPRSIRNIENGEAYPRVTTLQKIAAALNADLIISLVPKTGSELSESPNRLEEKAVKLDDIDIEKDSTFEIPSSPVSGRDIQIGETD